MLGNIQRALGQKFPLAISSLIEFPYVPKTFFSMESRLLVCFVTHMPMLVTLFLNSSVLKNSLWNSEVAIWLWDLNCYHYFFCADLLCSNSSLFLLFRIRLNVSIFLSLWWSYIFFFVLVSFSLPFPFFLSLFPSVPSLSSALLVSFCPSYSENSL